MTRFLKLIRHEDGKWKALPNETDDLAPVSPKERTYAPIDPDQLLKALDSLLSAEGGIKSVEDVPRLASLMKKFSKKLVSRCVYCNVLQATDPKILSEYLDKGGWETIHVWLEYAKSSTSSSFLIEMLKLCILLPMTVNRLKENNTAKLIKSLTKHENNDVKNLSSELVNKWMTIIKGKKSDVPVEKKKKEKKHKTDSEKKDSEKKDTEKKEKEKEDKGHSKTTAESPKHPSKLKGTKRPSSEKETKKVECYEDVKIDPEPLVPVSKKLKADRPKTAKVFQKKFRSTGLEEETPLPKKLSKKSTPTVPDKTAAVAAAKNALKLNSVLSDSRVTEKKLKPETLAAIPENSTSNKGLKLIPAKPRPAYVLHESASFMDALTQPTAAPVKRKKKLPPPNRHGNTPTSPTVTSPTMVPPKLQFYKDTLEMNDEKKDESEKENSLSEKQDGSPKKEEEQPKTEEEEPMEVSTEDGGHTPPNNDSNDALNTSDKETKDETPNDPNHIRSILSHGRRKGKKKSVKWVEEENIKEVFYFEMDENERVNVLKTQNFGEMKSMDLAKEREAIELSKRQMGDKMEEMTRWWIAPIIIDLPPSLVELGSQSKEKETEKLRQQSTLQEIYFTREMIPDSPHEPDLEIVPQQEPKIIPLDENNVICPPTNYSTYEMPKPAILPDVLSSLIMKSGIQQLTQHLPNNNIHEQIPMDQNIGNQPHLNMDPMSVHMHMAAPYDPAEPLTSMPPNNMLGPPNPNMPPNMFNMNSPPDAPHHNMAPPPQNEWRTLDMVQDQYFNGGFPPNNNHNMMPPPHDQGVNMRPRMMHDNFRPPMGQKGPPRGMGPRGRFPRIPCRHFLAGGCRFGLKCTFLHPGVNGPM